MRFDTARWWPESEIDGEHEAADEETDPLEALSAAVVELSEEDSGDILVFLPGEREIREAAESLQQTVSVHRRLSGTEVLPLFGRLSLAEQRRVFSPGAVAASSWPPTSRRRR
ncbi:hypothetical protein [Nesterenkonia pannonica]|uniref:hypothetical protein n=1 Tax=Nesterenkonia pannonica TaxID=1548602 RepID=UPI0021648BA1|nr:hypothetical protein [Nesterenkonia pannonica]